MDKKYYVYGLFEESSDTPFYIGKGCDRRARRYSLDKKPHSYMLECKFKNLKNNNKKLQYKILFQDKSEHEAFEIEKELIKKYGKKCDDTGILFNVTDGGDQPPSVEFIKKIYGAEKYQNQKRKRHNTFYENYYIKNFEEVLQIEKMILDGMLIKDIAEKINRDRSTVSKWIKFYNLKYDYTKKKILEIERLQSFKVMNSKKIQKTSKRYIVVDSNGEEREVLKLVIFCRENNLDYRGLRNTYRKYTKSGIQSKCKGFWIKQQNDPFF